MNLRQTSICVFICCFFAPTLSAQKPSLNVLDFGAKGDGKTLNTRFLQAAIDSCDKRGGGAIVIPAGKFLTGTLFLKSNLRVHLEAGCELVGSANLADYDTRHKHLLYGNDLKHFSLSGKGTINGNGTCFFDNAFNALERPAPFIVIENSEDISIKDIKIENSPAHTLVFSGCNRVVVDAITILNDMRSPNTDGIDITSTSNVMISNCFISTGDDAICLKSYQSENDKGDELALPTLRHSDKATENVTVTNCIIESDDGALKLGTGSGNPIRYCSFNNIIIRNSRFGIALFMKDGGVYEHLQFSNLHIQTSSRHATEYPIYVDVDKRDNRGRYGIIRHVRFSEIDIQTRGNCLIAGQAQSPLVDFTLERITMRVENAVDVSNFKKPRGNKKLGEIAGSSDFANVPAHFTVAHAEDVSFNHLRISDNSTANARYGIAFQHLRGGTLSELSYNSPNARACILLTDSEHFAIERCRSSVMPFLNVLGNFAGRLLLIGNAVGNPKTAFQFSTPALRKQVIEQHTLQLN